MSNETYEGVALVGMAGRFPGAESVEELWANLIGAKETVSFFSDAELAESGLDAAALRSRGHYVPARGVLSDADCFDAAFFGIHPKEAEVMDPQQRLFLEICWQALERAGYAPNQMRAAVGVFAGVSFNTYYLHALHQRQDLIDLVGHELVMFGNEKDYVATRVAYKLGLKGPAVNVSTACSTSLVAVAQACQSLLTYQCDVAVAGGASVTVPQKRGYFHDEGNIGSADGHTRTFDAKSSGTSFGNGVAAVVLKRLADAVADGDRVYAVIKAAALNNDGAQRVSFGAPGVEGQSEVIAMAHAMAGVEPDTITYVEAHGTATPLGDPIEVAALTKAFRLGTQSKNFCGLGSVKTNVGHLDVAAGVTGLIKVALSLHNRVLPPSLHFTTPNPKLQLDDSPFYVNASLREWNAQPGMPLRAGISSFGTGGTNAHLVLEEAPKLPAGSASRAWQLLTLSAKTPEALERATTGLSEHLAQTDSRTTEAVAAEALADAAFTLQTGRSEFVHRRIAVCRDAIDGAAALGLRDPKRVYSHQQRLKEPPIVFMFPGQGAQYAGMGAELYRSEAVFKAEVDRCAELLEPILGCDLRSVMFDAPAEGAGNNLLIQTRYTQPALFTIEYALATLWMSWGIRPSSMIGHSVGEYVAGCLAGVFTLDEALRLVARRGALVQAQPGGAMLAVRLPEKDVAPLLSGQMAIAAINAPSLCVVAGPYEAMTALEQRLASQDVVTRHLHTSHAFHSPMMDPVLAPFTDLFAGIELKAPTIPYVSNVTARWITPEEAQSADYWARHVRDTVRFADGIAELMKDPTNILLEVGPGQTLSTLSRQQPAKTAEQIVLASLPLTGSEEPRGVLETLGRLWMAGAKIDWNGFYSGERRCRVVLPTYPFERKRYWPEPARVVAQPVAASAPIDTHTMPTAATDPPVVVSTVVSTLEPPMPPAAAGSRKDRLRGEASVLLQDLSGYDLAGVDPATDLLELGLDSLLLTQAATLFQRKFGVSLTFRQLMEELNSVEAIAVYLDEKLPPDAIPAPAPAPTPPVAAAGAILSAPVTSVGVAPGTLAQLLVQQQQLTNQLLQLMGQQVLAAPAVAAPSTAAPAAARPAAPALFADAKPGATHGPFRPMDRSAGNTMTPAQTLALEQLIARYTKRTGTSKKIAAQNRPVLADPRSAAGFKQFWKEMVYPIVTERSEGSKVWDVDGNEYVDFVMGFGASLFGHRPPFVTKAVREQLDAGFEIGPIQPIAGEVAALIREMTGMERVGFTNTGSEAILAATRVSRTVTGRDKIAVFAGAYHGIFDEVLFRPVSRNGEPRAAAIAPGIPGSALEQVIVLDYGNPASLDYLRAHGSDIAAVLVEPVQSRRLDLQPKEFLQELRRVTEESGTALIFDEVVTGFRVQPGGAQAHFGIRADLATYGKVVGGGLPIGVVTGTPRFMDALDGGMWQYGDASFPEVGVTFFAGTFVRHPLVLAAAKAVLLHLKQQGPELQQRLNERTGKLARDIQAVLDEFDAPYHLTQFSSLMHLTAPSDQKLSGLLFYLLRDHGIHIYDNRAFVITTSHTDEDFARLLSALRESLTEMRNAGFLAPAPDDPRKPREANSASPDGRSTTGSVTFPLTDPQREIWLASQMGGDAAIAYNESLKLDFRGPFDIEAFRFAAETVFRRHPILLASISPDGDVQSVDIGRRLDVPVDDLSALESEVREGRLSAMIEREVTEPFDLAVGPLARLRVVRLTTDHHVALWTAHHIVCDGWSGGLIVTELAKLYSAARKGTAPELDVPVAFHDYARTLEAVDETSALSYWQKQFTELPPPLNLPTDRMRPPVRTAGASTRKRRLPDALHQALKRTASQNRVTTVVLLMAALQTLLHRLSGQADVVIGLPVAGQGMSGQNCLVGHCVNLVPIRTQLSPDASFKEHLGSVRGCVLDAYDHCQTTIGTILQHLRVPRSSDRPPLVEVIFNVDRDPGGAEFDGIKFECDRNPKRALHFDLFFNFVEGPHSLWVECDYNIDLFDSATIDRWLGHYETLMASIATDASQTVAHLQLLSEAERQQIAIEWNSTEASIPSHMTLHGLFERQVEKSPTAVALTFDSEHLTYDALNRRANGLARHLRTLGVGPDVLVALCADRSVEMVVGVLAILKAGGAYVPLDISYPQERLAFMLEDGRAAVLLTHRHLADRLPPHNGNVVFLDDAREEDDSNVAATATPDNLAYVIYTSGSTGKPKGVLLEHRSVVNLISSILETPGFGDGDVMLAVTTLSFDIATAELFLPLAAGGKLVVAPSDVVADGPRLRELVERVRPTFMQPTPSTWRLLLEAGWQGLPGLKIISTGEPLPPQLASQLRFRGASLWNLYGPTETTIWSTGCQVTEAEGPIPIGRPIANTETFLLDGQFEIVPIGVPGELFIGGAGVARGYLNRPELTAEKFLPMKLSGEPTASRYYRTGDLARYRTDGMIELLGRIDHQVKLRGFRIELGEIESVLSRHESVKQCVVVARPGPAGETILAAYIESASDQPPASGDLRRHLKQALPEFMIPTAFVTMERLPLTPNGKINRQALPGIDRPVQPASYTSDAPRDPLEQMLVRLWSKVLKVPKVGLNDNFFELGGHSILAVRILIEIEKSYGKRIPVATLIHAPTIAELADVLRRDDWKPSWSSLVPIQPGGSRTPLFLMHSHGGNVLEYYPLAVHFEKDQPVYALQARGLDGHIVRGQSLEQMAAHYLAEIKALQPEGPYVLGGFCFGGLLALEAAQQLTAVGEHVELVIMMQTTHPAVNKFTDDTTSLQRVWYRATKRLDLERENFRNGQKRYFSERGRRALDVALARTAIGFDNLLGTGNGHSSHRSMPYILESLSIEHDRVFENYVPRQYDGDVLLFRAAKQLQGLSADEFLGWKGVLRGRFEVKEAPGHQQNMLDEPNVKVLADEISGQLNQSAASSTVQTPDAERQLQAV